jgi:RHS repeat-associated protein
MGNRSMFTYDDVGRKRTESHPLGRGIAYEYDNMDRLTSVTDVLGGVVSFDYDDNGNKTEHTDANRYTTTFGYDAKNRLETETTPLNEKETYAYDSMDRRTDVNNRRGRVSSVLYDDAGNVIQQRDADDNIVKHQYDANGNRTSTTDARNYTTRFEYDALNRLEKTTNPYGRSITQTYDDNGNLRTVTDPEDNTTRYVYDALNRLKTITDPLNNVTRNEYDELGQLKMVTDAEENVTRYEYDALGRLKKVIDAESGIVEAEYDALGNRTSVTDTRSQVTHYVYDKLNRLTHVTDPLGNTKEMHYDPVGNLIAMDEPDDTSTHTYSYDKNNRLKKVSYPDVSTTVATYDYDANGNRLSLLDGMGTTSYTYGNRDELSSITDPFAQTVGYIYDANGNRTVIEYPGTNKRVTYVYDKVNRLESVRDWNYVQTSYLYDLAGRLKSMTMGNGATVSYTYDDAGRLTLKEDKTAESDVIARYDITLDDVGNRKAMTATQPLTPTVEIVDVAFDHDRGNLLLSANNATFAYDSKGNRITKDDGTVTTQYAYDYRNMLTRVSDGTHVQEYSYTSNGHRLKAVRDGVETRYALDLNGGMEKILAEMDGSNTISKYFIYGDGLLYSIDAISDVPVFYHYDTIGSTVALTTHNGDITDQYAYLPFGEPAGKEIVHDNVFTYVGKYGVMAEPNGLYFMRARYYDPLARRFFSEDPVKGKLSSPSSLNLYAYVGSNPVVRIDPGGEFAFALDIMPAHPIVPAHTAHPHVHIKPKINWHHAKTSLSKYARKSSKFEKEALDDLIKWPSITGGEKYIVKTKSEKIVMLGGLVRNELVLEIKKTPIDALNDEVTNNENSGPDPQIPPSPTEGSSNNSNSEGSSNSSNSGEEDIPKWLGAEQVFNYATSHYRREFRKLLNSSFIDNQARSYIETTIYREAASLSQRRYRIADEDKMKTNVQRKVGSLYKNFTQTLSKYSVLVKDLSDLPSFNSLNMNRRGVYAK